MLRREALLRKFEAASARGAVRRDSMAPAFAKQAEIVFRNSFEDGELTPCVPGMDNDQDGLLDLRCVEEFVPPDPATVAPPSDPQVVDDWATLYSFLYDGPNPIQREFDIANIPVQRIAVARGRVLDGNAAPLAGVLVRVMYEARLGYTYTRADGSWDMAVVGGGSLDFDFQKTGFIRAQRTVRNVPWNGFAFVEDAALVALDDQVTTLVMGAATPAQFARGSVLADVDGTRQATVLLPAGTSAEMYVAGETAPRVLPSISFRATEYTVGDHGSKRMPAVLPPSSGYTYAVELSADQAIAANNAWVQFSQPISFYVDNFLAFPVGTPVPVGYYDTALSRWMPNDNGRVIKVVSTAGGIAAVDLNGSGIAATSTELANAGFTGTELSQLATLYTVGQELWRAQIDHLTPWDHNFPYAPPGDAIPPTGLHATAPNAENEDSPCEEGSLIECDNRVLREQLPIAGTSHTLSYRSGRNQASAFIKLAPATIPASLEAIEVEWIVGGKRQVITYPPDTNFEVEVPWDGKDAYGRPIAATVAQALVSYVYPAQYVQPQNFGRAWAGLSQTGVSVGVARSGVAIKYSSQASVPLRNPEFFQASVAGWSLDSHHRYDDLSKTLIMGDGRTIASQSIAEISERIAGGRYSFGNNNDGVPASLATFRGIGSASADRGGKIWIVDNFYGSPLSHKLLRIDDDGFVRRLEDSQDNVGSCTPPCIPTPDVWPWEMLQPPRQVELADDGCAFVLTQYTKEIVKICGDVAWTHWVPPSGSTNFFTRGPDGHLYADSLRFTAGGYYTDVYRIDPDIADLYSRDVVFTAALPNGYGGSAEGVPLGQLEADPYEFVVDRNGDFFLLEPTSNLIRRVDRTGRVSRVAGRPESCGTTACGGFAANGTVARDARLSGLTKLHALSDGTLTFGANFAIRSVGSDGFLGSRFGIAGASSPPVNCQSSGDSNSVTGCGFGLPPLATVTSNGNALVDLPDGDAMAILGPSLRRVKASRPETELAEFLVPGPDASELFRFSSVGRHTATIDSRTGLTIRTFEYDSDGLLSRVVDRFGNALTIHRDSEGLPETIESPDGVVTTLSVDASGKLSGLQLPNGDAFAMTSWPDGRLKSFALPGVGASQFVYSARGELMSDENNSSGRWDIGSSDSAEGRETILVSAEGRQTSHTGTRAANGAEQLQTTKPDGTVTSREYNASGVSTMSQADGTTSRLQLLPDPRFQMQSPLPQVDITLPSGNKFSLTTKRTATLAQASDPLSLNVETTTHTVNGRVFTTVFDRTTRTYTFSSAAGLQGSATLNADGQLSTMSAPGLEPLSFAYDPRGRLSGYSSGGRSATFTYDTQGYLETVTDPVGRSILNTRDPNGRVIARALPGGRTVSYGYDARDNVTSIIPPGRSAHLFTYSPVNQLKSYTPPAVAGVTLPTTTYDYNSDKQLEMVTKAGGLVVDFSYSPPTGKLAQVTTPDGTFAYGYHPTTGKLQSITSPGGISNALSFDGMVLTAHEVTGPMPWRVDYSYNNNFWLTSMSIQGVVMDYVSNSNGQLESAAVGSDALTLSHNTQNGQLEGTYIGSVSDAWTYTNFSEPMTYTARYFSAPMFEASYGRDSNSRINSLTENGVATTIVYDAVGRVDTLTRGAQVIADFGYDVNGNRNSVVLQGDGLAFASGCAPAPVSGLITIGAGTDAQDRMTSFGDCTFTYADNGELASKTDASSGEVTQFQYDVAGNLRHAELPDGTELDYLIDGMQRRIGKKVDGVLVQGFAYGNQLEPIAELDASGNLIASFVYAERPHVPSFMLKGGQVYRIVADHLGSVRLVVNIADGTIAQQLSYGPWGEVLTDTNPGFQPFGYAGGVYDRDLKLVRFGSRDYDPEIGRWTAKDPVRFAGGDFNLYAYAHNDPINRIDPDGEIAPIAWWLAGFAAEMALDWALDNYVMPAIEDWIKDKFGCENTGFARNILDALLNGMAAVDLLRSLKNPAKWDDLMSQMAGKHSSEHQALKDMLKKDTLDGRKPLSADDGDAALDLANELKIPDVRDDRMTNHWAGGPHIHIPGMGIPHIPASRR
jgi:RHS repeat-associated protein